MAKLRRIVKDWAWVERLCITRADVIGMETKLLPKLGLICINTPLVEFQLRHMWALSEIRVCADGAANRLHSICSDLIPEVVVGDLDSATHDVLDFYRGLGTKIRDLSHDQNSTDLEKALRVVIESGCEKAVVAGLFAGVEGRLDHFFGIANTLRRHSEFPVAVVGDDSFMLLLDPGEHKLVVPGYSSMPHCGLVPLGVPCRKISTQGLMYDMTDASMEFGGLVSVCNRADPSAKGQVWVNTSDYILWMCTIPRPQLE